MHRAAPRAGASTRARYEELAARWRRRALKRLYFIAGPLLLGLIVLEGAVHHLDAWAVGLLSGGTITLCVCMSEEVPERIARWRRGYEGELKTAKQLAVFGRRGCVVLHDLADRRTETYKRGNLDHVLVAPWGVFLLDSKAYRGSVTVAGDAVRVTDVDTDDESVHDRLSGAMRSRAARLHEDLLQQAGLSARIEPVVVFWSDFEAGSVSSNGVHYVHGPKLADWIEERQRDSPVATDVQLVAARIRATRSAN